MGSRRGTSRRSTVPRRSAKQKTLARIKKATKRAGRPSKNPAAKAVRRAHQEALVRKKEREEKRKRKR